MPLKHVLVRKDLASPRMWGSGTIGLLIVVEQSGSQNCAFCQIACLGKGAPRGTAQALVLLPKWVLVLLSSRVGAWELCAGLGELWSMAEQPESTSAISQQKGTEKVEVSSPPQLGLVGLCCASQPFCSKVT